MEFTEPLASGAALPDHPADTTARKVIKYLSAFDSHDGHELSAGLHRNEIEILRQGETGGLSHLYRYSFVQEGKNLKIYHTRNRVVISVLCKDDADVQ